MSTQKKDVEITLLKLKQPRFQNHKSGKWFNTIIESFNLYGGNEIESAELVGYIIYGEDRGMVVTDAIKLIEKYAKCPQCGSELIGGGEGILIIDDDKFTRKCKCGYHHSTTSVEVTEGGETIG